MDREKGHFRCCFTGYPFVADAPFTGVLFFFLKKKNVDCITPNEPACSPFIPVLIQKKPGVKTTDKQTFVKGAHTVPELCLNGIYLWKAVPLSSLGLCLLCAYITYIYIYLLFCRMTL